MRARNKNTWKYTRPQRQFNRCHIDMPVLPEVERKVIFWDPGSSPFSHTIISSGVVAHNICIDNELKYLSLFPAYIMIPHPICGLHCLSISILKHIGASEGHCFTFVPSDRWSALQSFLEMRNGGLEIKKVLPKYNQSRVMLGVITLQLFSSPGHSSTAWAVDQCLWTQSFQHLYFFENGGSGQKILSSGIKKIRYSGGVNSYIGQMK